jgi:hypothetical protein
VNPDSPTTRTPNLFHRNSHDGIRNAWLYGLGMGKVETQYPGYTGHGFLNPDKDGLQMSEVGSRLPKHVGYANLVS